MVEFRLLGPEDETDGYRLWVSVFSVEEAYFRSVVEGTVGDMFAYGAWVDGKLVSTVCVFERPIRDRNGRVQKVAGLANVATDPDHRKQGYSGRLIERCLSEMESRGYEWSYLGTGVNDHYARYGWRTVSLPMIHSTLRPAQGAEKPEVVLPDPEVLSEMARLDDVYHQDRPMTQVRAAATWSSAMRYQLDPSRSQIAVARESGSLSGYVVVRWSDDSARVVDAAGPTEVLHGLLRGVAREARDRNLKKLSLVCATMDVLEPGLRELCDEVTFGEGRWTMARPIANRMTWPDLAALKADPRGRYSELDAF